MFQNLQNNVAVGSNGNQLTHSLQNQGFSLTVDYLILNLNGKLSEDITELLIYNSDKNPFRLILQDFGTKIFKFRYQVFFGNECLGWLFTSPHSTALNENLCQFQFENFHFYTKSLTDLLNITTDFCNYTGLHFQSVNRLDVALDLENKGNFYQNLMSRILNNDLIISGKDKKITPYFITEFGKPQLTGFSIGSRTASRFLRVYNKTLEMLKNPKEYILNTWEAKNLDVKNIWRFEYQLNSAFFRNLNKVLPDSKHNPEVSETLTFGIFDEKIILSLLQLAEKNHFEIKYNTGKSQINKEKTFIVINWDVLKNSIGYAKTVIKRIKKIVEPSALVVKRMAKAVFREYYQSKQNSISHILSLNNLLDDYSNNLFSLKTWFNQKLPFYIDEFEKKQTQDFSFDYNLYKQHSIYAI